MSDTIIKGLLASLAPGGQRGRLSILIYHRVLRTMDTLLPDVPDAATFRWQLRLLARWFHPLSLDEAIQRLYQGTLPARAVCVTFDDGYADNLEVALPILQAEGVPATFFIATAFLDGGRMFNDTVIETVRRLPTGTHDLSAFGLGHRMLHDESSRIAAYSAILSHVKYASQPEREALTQRLSERLHTPLPDDLMLRHEQVGLLRQAGMGIGAHTASHPILARLTDHDAAAEIQQGRHELESLLGEPVTLFAYPNGKPGRDYGAQHVAMVRHAGFKAAVSTAWGGATRTCDPFQLPRFTPWDRTSVGFVARLAHNMRRTPALV